MTDTKTEPNVLPPQEMDFDVQTLIIGAGAGGMVAALAAAEAGQEVLVLEADAIASGSTALSAGLIPAAATRFQRDAKINDTPETFARDIQNKAHDENDQALVDALSQGAGPAIEWLATRHGLPFSLVTDFDYPGHSHRRMHGLPTRSGQELIDSLRAACEDLGIDIIYKRRVTTLFADGKRITGVMATRGDGGTELIGCERLILACNGFGANRDLVRAHMPDIADALWFGHESNLGEAVGWADKLGAATRHLGAYQGHGNVASPNGILITWAVITEGGVQVNLNAERFWNEAQGYSEAARHVLAQPEGVAWTIFDGRIADIARQFADFKDAEGQGAIRTAETISGLAEVCNLDAAKLEATLAAVPTEGPDAFGRSFNGKALKPPYCAVKVTGALFHTQGGLDVTPTGQVKAEDGSLFPNLFAVGGAACGVSGSADSGYLSGNGLLSAVVLGRAAGIGA